MKLTIIRCCETESGRKIPIVTTVQYLGHVLGGMVKVIFDGDEEIIHPLSTKEL